MKKLLYIMICAFLLVSFPASAQASLWDDVVSFVKAGAIGAPSSKSTAGRENDPQPETDTQVDAEEETDDPAEAETVESSGDSGMCRVPRAEPEIICEPGAGFLCLNTPDFGVAEDHAVIRGTLDRVNAVVANIAVAVQHEYTKNTVVIDTSSPLAEDCWQVELDAARPFCLDAEGFYAARIPLDDHGPHTVSVSMVRLSGEPVEKNVRLSRVVAPEFTRDAVAFDPLLDSDGFANASTVNVAVSLLDDCQFCDFIGASTGAVTVTVENAITDANGSERRVSCSTNVEQGGQGRFILGVPVGAGENSFKVSVCSVALPQDCIVVSDFSADGPTPVAGFNIISPEPQPAYDADEYPVINWEFSVGGLGEDACVEVQFNRTSPETVCAQNGVFRTKLEPHVGINVATVTVEDGAKTMPWTFGWGDIVSPFDSPGGSAAGNGIVAENAFQLALPANTLTNVLQPILANVVGSEKLGDLLRLFTSSTPPTRGTPDTVDPNALERQETVDAIAANIRGCGGGGDDMMAGKRIEIVGQPKVGSVAVEDMRLERDKLYFKIEADDVEVRIKLVTDKDMNGVPEGTSLPLLLKFHKLVLTLQLTVEEDDAGRKLIVIGSPYTDCDYKSDDYCTGMPAPLIAGNIVGAATDTYNFVRCDSEGQPSSDRADELCGAVNRINAQTGLVSEKILDAINGMLSCTGSAAVTHMLRGGMPEDATRVGCFPDDPEDERGPLMGCSSGMPKGLIGPWLLSLGAHLADGFEITKDGILATGDLRVGNADIFDSLEPDLHHPSVGIITDPNRRNASVPISDASGAELMQLALSSDGLSSLFFLMTHQSYQGAPAGVFDIDLSEVFFKQLGFDFVEQCDAFDAPVGSDATPSSLCNIRPRVGALLGTSLSTYKYFSPKHPVLMRIRGNRALTPYVRIVSEGDIPIIPRTSDDPFGTASEDKLEGGLVDLQLGGVMMSFYALEIDETVPLDEFGNPTVLLDDNGQPVIHSMRPGGDPGEGQIISFELTLLLALELGDVTTDPDDPRQLVMRLRPLADRTRLVLTPVPGSNATTVPPEGLVSALREKLQMAISIFSAKDQAISIPLPKRLDLSPAVPTPDALMGMLGLQELVFGKDGLQLTWDANSSFLTIDLGGTLKQVFDQNGRTYTETY